MPQTTRGRPATTGPVARSVTLPGAGTRLRTVGSRRADQNGPVTSFTIESQFCGPDESANGGYTCGVVAGLIEGDAEVTLRYPPPLETRLDVTYLSDGVTVGRGDFLVAEATVVEWSLHVPEPPTLEQAATAVTGYPGFTTHEFPNCFVCGIDRNPGDGLRLFTGPVADRDDGLVACPWVPDPGLPSTSGFVDPEIVWAVLDCPGAWAEHRAEEDHPPVVLGRMAARIVIPVPVEGSYIAAGWPTGRDGRKLYSGTALWAEDGTLHGYARQTWIVVSQ